MPTSCRRQKAMPFYVLRATLSKREKFGLYQRLGDLSDRQAQLLIASCSVHVGLRLDNVSLSARNHLRKLIWNNRKRSKKK